MFLDFGTSNRRIDLEQVYIFEERERKCHIPISACFGTYITYIPYTEAKNNLNFSDQQHLSPALFLMLNLTMICFKNFFIHKKKKFQDNDILFFVWTLYLLLMAKSIEVIDMLFYMYVVSKQQGNFRNQMYKTLLAIFT